MGATAADACIHACIDKCLHGTTERMHALRRMHSWDECLRAMRAMRAMRAS